MILDKILADRRIQIEEAKLQYGDLKRQLKERNYPVLEFKKSITTSHELNIIAEIKLRTPFCTERLIQDEDKALQIVKEYEDIETIKAISVVGEEKYFGGSLTLLKKIKETTNLPILYKDFILDDLQIYAAYINGADAVLLITSFLSTEFLNKFIGLIKKLNMTPVVEVHKESDLKKINMNEVDVVLINNRNLYTFNVDIVTSLRLKIYIPDEKIIISASGIKTKLDIKYLTEKNIKVVLIGEALLRSNDIREKVKELVG